MTINCTIISTRYNCTCILVLIILKMAAWVAETCLWFRCSKTTFINKITFINPNAFVGPFKNVIHLINAWDMERIKTFVV